MMTREIAEIRKELPAISRLENELDLRQAEDARLSNLVGTAHNQLNQINQRFDPIINELAYVNEMNKRHTNQLTELEGQLLTANKKTEDVRPRIDLVADRVVHMEANIADLTREQADVYKNIKSWTEQIQLGEYERKNRLDTWERFFQEQQEVMERYKKEWLRYNEQFQESKMAVQSLAPWREQQETRAKELFETQRLETNRLLSQWQNFIDDEDKKWRNFEVDTEQRIASRQRRETEFQKAIAALEDELVKVNQDKEMLWRVQNAQADALKQFPRIWLEEVERTLEQNPYRRRQPTMIAVRED
jgi:chromosome segregation ATPase